MCREKHFLASKLTMKANVTLLCELGHFGMLLYFSSERAVWNQKCKKASLEIKYMHYFSFYIFISGIFVPFRFYVPFMVVSCGDIKIRSVHMIFTLYIFIYNILHRCRARNSRGPRGQWPPDFPNGPPVFEDGAQRALKFFEPAQCRYTCLGPRIVVWAPTF